MFYEQDILDVCYVYGFCFGGSSLAWGIRGDVDIRNFEAPRE